MAYDFTRPFIEVSGMESYTAVQSDIAVRYGGLVKAIPITNREYGDRHAKFALTQKMKEPPGSVRSIFPGFLGVRNIGTPVQYETWIPHDAFEEMYGRQKSMD